MNMLNRLYEKKAEGKTVVSIDWVIDAIHHETQYTPRTDVPAQKTINASSNVIKWRTSQNRLH